MLVDTAFLAVSLVVILIGAELFTNGVEWLGQRLNLSEGVVGSVLAAVGTALPETLIPVVAVLFFTGSKHGDEVGIGAIAGAPFMLTTLTLSLCGWSIWYYGEKGRRPKGVQINKVVVSRDLRFFILAYSAAVAATLARDIAPARWMIAVLLCLIYFRYLFQTFKQAGEVGEAPEQLYLDRVISDQIIAEGSSKLRLIIPQVLLGLVGITGGAFLFVDHVQSLALDIGIPTVVLSLIIAPVATELPEKINSILWARSGKDTLALGNVTGALVFQSCWPAAFGIAFTHWNLGAGTVATAVVAIISALIYLKLIQSDSLKPGHLMLGAVAYTVTITVLLATGAHHH